MEIWASPIDRGAAFRLVEFRSAPLAGQAPKCFEGAEAEIIVEIGAGFFTPKEWGDVGDVGHVRAILLIQTAPQVTHILTVVTDKIQRRILSVIESQ